MSDFLTGLYSFTSNAGDMDAAVAQLESHYTLASTKAATTFFWPGLGGGEAAENALYVARRQIDALKGDFKSEVLAGTRTFASWQSVAEDANANLRTILSTLPGLSFSGIVGNAAQDFKESATTAARTAAFAGGTTLLLVVVGLVALAVIRVGPVRR